MSHIDDLLAELCPGGVPFVSLADVARTVSGLSGKTKTDFSDGNSRFVTYKNVFANLVVDENVQDFVKVSINEKQNRLHVGDVVFTGSSENVEDVGLSSVVTTEPQEPLYLNSFCFVVRFTDPLLLLPAFSKYLFRSAALRKQIRLTASGVTRINVSKGRFLKIRIPVPPLEVQREIVRILDQFTQLEAELETELEAELAARSRRYAHFQQLAFLRLNEPEVRKVPLREVGTWYGGGTPSKSRADYWKSGTIPWISPKDMGHRTLSSTEDYITETAVAESATKLVPKESVALVVRSSILNHTLPIAFVPVAASLNQDMKAVVAGPGIAPRYLFHALRAHRVNLLRAARRSGGSVGSLESGKLWTFEIPVPGLQEQERLVALLDEFDTCVEELRSSLTCEVSARRKQYEYYRDRLLTFKEAIA